MDLNAAAEALIQLIANLTFMPIAAPLVLALVALLKRIIPASVVSAGTLALLVQALVWIAWLLARHVFDVDDATIKTWVEMLTVIGGAVAGFAGSAVLTQAAYDRAKARDVPLLGKARRV